MSVLIRNSTSRARFSRRALLRRMGVGAAMLPLLDSERVRAAGPGGAPRRIITIAWANGVAQPNFWPQSVDPTSTPILQPLAPLRSKVTVVAGIDLQCVIDTPKNLAGHGGFPALFTGSFQNPDGKAADSSGHYRATTASLDQALADELARSANLPVIPLCASPAGIGYYIGWTSYRADGGRNTPETDPTRLFNNLFKGRNLTPDRLQALQARRKSILDFTSGELTTFGARMGADDKAKIAGHLDSIRKLEGELSVPVATCDATAPVPGDYAKTVKAFNDLVAVAVKCDVTRAFSLIWAGDGGSNPGTMPFLDLMPVKVGQADGGSEIHAIAHQGSAGYARKAVIDSWFIQQLAYLATALDGIAEAGTRALDNTLIVMANSMNEGAFHGVDAIPVVMVGGGGLGGAIRPGRVVKLGTWAGRTGSYWKAGRSGVPNNRLLASIMHAVGVELPGGNFGDPKYPGNVNAELRG